MDINNLEKIYEFKYKAISILHDTQDVTYAFKFLHHLLG